MLYYMLHRYVLVTKVYVEDDDKFIVVVMMIIYLLTWWILVHKSFVM